MTTLKQRIYNILFNKSYTRDSDKILQWCVCEELGLTNSFMHNGYLELFISHDNFMKAPQPESIRRPAQQSFRSDRLLGENKIQPARIIKERRQKLADEHGASFIMAKQPVYNPEKGVYEI